MKNNKLLVLSITSFILFILLFLAGIIIGIYTYYFPNVTVHNIGFASLISSPVFCIIFTITSSILNDKKSTKNKACEAKDTKIYSKWETHSSPTGEHIWAGDKHIADIVTDINNPSFNEDVSEIAKMAVLLHNCPIDMKKTVLAPYLDKPLKDLKD